MRWITVMLASFATAACSVLGDRSGTEQVDYEVRAALGESVKVRDYGPRVVAETTVAPDDGSPSNTAFQRLFDYIQGANQASREIAMTAPVETEAAAAGRDGPSEETSAQKIEMTAPVEIDTTGERYRMAFFLPQGTTLASAPVPTNAEVSLREISSRLEAVKPYSGSRADAAVARETQALLAILQASEWQTTGPVRSYFYDPPWTLPWLRRNEVAVPVTRRAEAAAN